MSGRRKPPTTASSSNNNINNININNININNNNLLLQHHHESSFPDDEAAIIRSTAEENTASALSLRVPEEYLYDPLSAEPKLDHLRNVMIAQSEREEKYDPLTSAANDGEINSGEGGNPMAGGGGGLMDMASHGHGTAQRRGSMTKDTTITDILTAAEKDVNLHLSRIKAVLSNNPHMLDTYTRSGDGYIQERAMKLEIMEQKRDTLQSKSMDILKSLSQNINVGGEAGLTASEVQQARLDAWEKALEWYVYCPPDYTTGAKTHHTGNSNTIQSPARGAAVEAGGSNIVSKNGLSAASSPPPPSSSSSPSSTKPSLTLHQLIQHLTSTCISEDDETTSTIALEKATQLCASHLESASSLLSDASENTGLNYEAYAIHLMAHGLASQGTLRKSEKIQNQFLLHGREALKIGSALELAEAKRRQSDNASLLIRRWWMMENLAEQEILSKEQIRVSEEVQGFISSSSCRMDPLFTRPENSIEAARTLKNLRMVVRCRSTANTTSNIGNDFTGGTVDPQANERFNITDMLIQRTSAALEQRLLSSFTELYTAEGTYDFSSIKAASRPGRLDWIALRDVAEALMNFDSGRSLHKTYVGLVISTKFPELFEEKDIFATSEPSSPNNDQGEGGGRGGETKDEFDVDATRSKLSNLFHRVCEVCTDEFKLIAHVFSPTLPPHLQDALNSTNTSNDSMSFTETFPLQVARALLQRIISDRNYGLQTKIYELLESIDQKGDSDSGAKKLDTFVVIHEKAASLFSRLKDAAQKMWGSNTSIYSKTDEKERNDGFINVGSNAQAVASLTQFLTSQEKNLSSGQRRGYFNLELRLLHHDCCVNLGKNGGKLTKPVKAKEDAQRAITGFAGLADYRAPIVALDKKYIIDGGFHKLLQGPLRQSVSRQPLIHATDALARARLMFGSGFGGDIVDSTARVVITIFTQMCNFYGQSYLYPILESLTEMVKLHAPNSPPSLPFDEGGKPHDLGVDAKFWVSIERVHSAARSFERELWAENRTGSIRVWEILVHTRSQTSLTLAKDRRIKFFQELEERGEAAIMRALDALSAHIQWILVSGGESTAKTKTTAGNRLFAGSGGGPYAVPSGSILDSTNSPAVKALTFCLRSQFVHIQSALTPQSLAKFWTALSKRLFDILVTRLLQNYTVSTVGAVVLSRDVEGLRSVSMLAGSDHAHWDSLRELLTLYMTPPDSLKSMLVGAEGDINSGKGLFGTVGKDQSIVFMSRRNDYRYKTNQGMKKSQWAIALLEDLNIQNDPTDGRINAALYMAENITEVN